MSSSTVRPSASATNFHRCGAGSPTSTAKMRNAAKETGAFIVLNTLMRKGTGSPTLYISALYTQTRSHAGGSVN